MPRPPRKTPDELIQEATWSRRDIARIFRKKRIRGYMSNKEFMAESLKVLKFFEYRPYGG